MFQAFYLVKPPSFPDQLLVLAMSDNTNYVTLTGKKKVQSKLWLLSSLPSENEAIQGANSKVTIRMHSEIDLSLT